MRIGRVIGHINIPRRNRHLPTGGALLLVEAFDAAMLTGAAKRANPAPQSLVVYDELGAGVGSTIAFSEGGEATAPFYPDKKPVDAYCSAILDSINV